MENVLGNKAATLVNEWLISEALETSIDAVDPSSGV